MSDLFAGVKAALAKLSARLDLMPTFTWAVVTSQSPLRVRPEFATTDIAGKPSTLISGLIIGDRVLLLSYGRRAVIIGRAGGGASIEIPDPTFHDLTGVLHPTYQSGSEFGAIKWGKQIQLNFHLQSATNPVNLIGVNVGTLPVGYRPVSAPAGQPTDLWLRLTLMNTSFEYVQGVVWIKANGEMVVFADDTQDCPFIDGAVMFFSE